MTWARRLAALFLITLLSRSAFACPGDCNADGAVTIDELLLGVNIALDNAAASRCAAFDIDANGVVTIDELISAVNAALLGCPGTPTPRASSTPTASPTATPILNHGPVVTPQPIYRTYPNYPINYPLPVADPEGDPLVCAVGNLPNGALFDAPSRSLLWTPDTTQLGPAYIDFNCHDNAAPPADATGQLIFKVQRPSPCVVPQCDPASGCTDELVGLDQTCCGDGPVAPVEEPLAGCPQGFVFFAGGDLGGFGELGQCSLKTLLTAAQSSASVRFNLRAGCISTDDLPRFTITMETPTRVAVRANEFATTMKQTPEGWFEHAQASRNIDGPTPYVDLQGEEANVTLMMRDALNHRYTQKLRLRLTFTPIPDVGEPAPPRPTVTPTPAATPNQAGRL